MQSQDPTEEIAERFAEGTGLRTAAWAAGLRNHIALMAGYRQREKVASKVEAAALGKMSGVEADMPEEDVGDIIVTGDNHYYGDSGKRPTMPWEKNPPPPTAEEKPPAPPAPPDPQPPVVEQVQAALPTWVKVAIMAGTVLGSGAAGVALNQLFGVNSEIDPRDYKLNLLPPDEVAK